MASGLALATTLMAMQVADSMSSRACAYCEAPQQQADLRRDHGFLGIRYVFHYGNAEHSGYADIDSVLPNTPARSVDLQPGDHVLSINRLPIASPTELQERIFGSQPGATPTLEVDRHGQRIVVRPTLIAWPSTLR